MSANFLFRNEAGQFRETAVSAGVAASLRTAGSSLAEAGMACVVIEGLIAVVLVLPATNDNPWSGSDSGYQLCETIAPLFFGPLLGLPTDDLLLEVTGTLTLDGAISANGERGQGVSCSTLYCSGGAGGAAQGDVASGFWCLCGSEPAREAAYPTH